MRVQIVTPLGSVVAQESQRHPDHLFVCLRDTDGASVGMVYITKDDAAELSELINNFLGTTGG